jgi:hypothetical protein
MDRLFGNVLPHHPSLSHRIKLKFCSSRSIELLTSSLQVGGRLERLFIQGFRLEPNCAEAIAGMFRRNVGIQELRLAMCRLNAESCKTIWDSLVDNEHLTTLSITGGFVLTAVGAFAQPLGKRSALMELIVEAVWTADSFRSFVEGLRTNQALKWLKVPLSKSIEDEPSIPFETLVEDLLSNYNYTLENQA